ncbi:MAG: ABC transporter substrate-binding protein [Actinobacteria bacterium]|nr:ABC transporter substrate-binding protein [Actinomycetota bacterium]
MRTVAVLLLASALVACTGGPPEHVRIGVVAPLGGPRAYLGHEVRAGAEQAIGDLNDSGGLLGAPVELITVDDSDLVALPGQLAALAERERVSAVIGPEVPGVLLGPRNPLARRSVPALLVTAFGGDLAQADTTVVRTVPSAHAQTAALGRWLTDVRRVHDVAILIADPVEGTLVREAVVAGLDGVGARVAAVDEVAADSPDLGPAVARLRRRAPDARAVLLWAPPPAAARATRAIRDQGWDVQLAVPISAFVGEYRTLAGEASEGVVLPLPFREDWFGPRLQEWLLRWHRDRGISALPQLQTLVLDLPVAAMAAYDAVGLVAAAVRDAGSREPAAVADALGQVRHDGLLHDYRIGGGREAWDASQLYVARFHHLAVVYDVDPRFDAAQQRRFYELQVRLGFLPDEARDGPTAGLIEELLAERRATAPAYQPPLPPPGPVGRP